MRDTLLAAKRVRPLAKKCLPETSAFTDGQEASLVSESLLAADLRVRLAFA